MEDKMENIQNKSEINTESNELIYEPKYHGASAGDLALFGKESLWNLKL